MAWSLSRVGQRCPTKAGGRLGYATSVSALTGPPRPAPPNLWPRFSIASAQATATCWCSTAAASSASYLRPTLRALSARLCCEEAGSELARDEQGVPRRFDELERELGTDATCGGHVDEAL